MRGVQECSTHADWPRAHAHIHNTHTHTPAIISTEASLAVSQSLTCLPAVLSLTAATELPAIEPPRLRTGRPDPQGSPLQGHSSRRPASNT